MMKTRKLPEACSNCGQQLTQEYYPDDNFGNTGGKIEGRTYCDNANCPQYNKDRS